MAKLKCISKRTRYIYRMPFESHFAFASWREIQNSTDYIPFKWHYFRQRVVFQRVKVSSHFTNVEISKENQMKIGNF